MVRVKHLFNILLAAILLSAIPESVSLAAEPAVGDSLPSFFLRDINGANFYLTDYIGARAKTPCRGIVFSFCASYCEPCKKEIPELEKVAAKYREQGFRVFLVAIERQESARDLVKETGTTLPVLIDRYLVVQKLLGFEGIPYTVLVDGSGIIRYISTGFSESHASEAMERFEQEVCACLAADAADAGAGTR